MVLSLTLNVEPSATTPDEVRLRDRNLPWDRNMRNGASDYLRCCSLQALVKRRPMMSKQAGRVRTLDRG